MPYATDDKISQKRIKGAVEISDAEYEQARTAMINGGSVVIRDGSMRMLGGQDIAVYKTSDGSQTSIKENDDVPDGFTTEKPESDFSLWDGSQWVEDKAAEAARRVVEAGAHIVDYRWQRENEGVPYNGKMYHTDRETRAVWLSLVLAAQVDASFSVASYKSMDGSFVSLDATDILAVYSLGQMHIAKCFGAEATVASAHSTTGYTSLEAIATAFDVAYVS